MPIKVFTDECVHKDAVTALKNLGFDVVSIHDVGMRGSSDDEVLAKATELKRVLITHDRGFGDIFRYQISRTWGVLIFLVSHMDKEAIISMILGFLSSAKSGDASFKGLLTIVAKNRIRRIKYS